MARGRKPIEIDRIAFQMAVTAIENSNSFATRTALWEAVEASDWAKAQTPRPLTAQVAMMKAKEFNLEIKTPIGRRGKEKGCGPVVRTGPRKKKVYEDNIKDVIRTLSPKMYKKYAKTIKRFEKGSLKAAIKLKCLDCSGWKAGEVSKCQMTDCSLWSHRPHRRTSVVKELL